MAKRTATQEVAVDPGAILQLDPAVILAEDKTNTRYGLKQPRIDSLAKSIEDRGGVMVPVEVEPIDPVNGHHYRLVTGFYRVAAVRQLAEKTPGLTIPAIVHVSPDETERTKRQISENMDRENQSPMDVAIAINRLMKAGMNKIEVREVFSRPGGRKGNRVQPASNSFVNMHLSFLDLPKNIQTKVHEGVVGVAAAYELTKLPADRQKEVLAKAEEARQSELAREEKLEEKFLAQEKKAQARAQEREALAKAATEASAKLEQAAMALAETKTKADEAYALATGKHPDAKAKKEREKMFKEAEKARTIAAADELAAKKEAETTQSKLTKFDQALAEKEQKVAAAQAAPKQSVTPGDVKKAAKSSGASSTAVPLSLNDIRAGVKEMCLPGGNKDVIAIAEVFRGFIGGELTTDQAYKALLKLVS